MENLLWYQDPQWYAILVAFIVGVLSLYKDYIFRAKVDFNFKVVSPNCHKTKISYNLSTGIQINKAHCYYYRFFVESKNRITPEKLELMITKKWHKRGGEYILDNSFLPMSLKWSHYGQPILNNIAPYLFKFCDFGSIIDPQYQNEVIKEYGIDMGENIVSLYMDLEVSPYTGTNILLPGTYKFEFVLSGKNFSKIKKVYQIHLPNYWSFDENLMLTEGLRVEEI